MARLQHVACTYPPGEQEALRAFYGGVLGLPEMPVPGDVPAESAWVWFDTDDDGVELHFIPHGITPDPARIHHFCLQVDDVRALVATLEGAGYETWTAGTEIAGRDRVFVRDPFGNLVELVSIS